MKERRRKERKKERKIDDMSRGYLAVLARPAPVRAATMEIASFARWARGGPHGSLSAPQPGTPRFPCFLLFSSLLVTQTLFLLRDVSARDISSRSLLVSADKIRICVCMLECV